MKNFKEWIKAAGIRAIKTISQAAIATIGTTAVVLADVNWWVVLSTALMAGVLSVLTSLAGLPEVKSNETKDGKDEEVENLSDGNQSN